MRIIRLQQTLPPMPGGQEIHVRELTLRQLEMGETVDLVFAEGQAPRAAGLTPYPISLAHTGLASRWAAQQQFAWRAARVRLAAGAPVDVVHAHGDYAAAWAAWRLGRRFGCPSVLTIHSGLSERPAHWVLNRLFCPRLSHVIAVSPYTARQLERRGVGPERISVISSGIHVADFAPLDADTRARIRAQNEVPEAGWLVAAVGHLYPVKGFEYLIEAVRRAFERFRQLRLVVVGDGPERERLSELASACPGIRLAGALPQAEVRGILGAADLFALSSINVGKQREGTPTSIMEAMASGLPVVATRSGGIPFLVRDRENGLLVPEKNAPALAEAMVALLRDPAKRGDFGARNREAMRERDWSVIARRIGEVYENAAAGPTCGGCPAAFDRRSQAAARQDAAG